MEYVMDAGDFTVESWLKIVEAELKKAELGLDELDEMKAKKDNE